MHKGHLAVAAHSVFLGGSFCKFGSEDTWYEDVGMIVNTAYMHGLVCVPVPSGDALGRIKAVALRKDAHLLTNNHDLKIYDSFTLSRAGTTKFFLLVNLW